MGPGGFVAGLVGGAIVAGAIMATRPPGYVVYPGYAQPVHGPGCYWASQPVYDRWGRVVGYTGQPVQIAPAISAVIGHITCKAMEPGADAPGFSLVRALPAMQGSNVWSY